tara:strand:+ start:602 stop:2548 length:1947 start_codon:yes stop_codon:yes gene_type:complete
MKTILVEIDVEGAPQAIKNINDLENAIGSLEDELKQAEFGSEEFKKLSKELTKAQVALKNTELAIESLDSEQVASEFGSLTGAVGDVTGAFVLLGGEDGPIGEVGERISTAIGISMAFKGAIEGISSGRKLLNHALSTSTTLQKINNTVNVAATTIMGLFSKSVNTTSLSFKALKGAIMATGIGALVIGISSAISAIGDWISGTGDAEEAAEKFAAEIEETNKALDKQTKAFQNVGRELDRNTKLQIALAKAQGKSNEQIARMEENALKQKILNINKEISETTKLYNLKFEQSKGLIKMGVTEELMRDQNVKGMGDLFNKEAELQQQRKDLRADLTIMIKTNNANEIKEEKKKQQKIREGEKKASQERRKERNKNKEEAEKDAKEQAEKELQILKEKQQKERELRNEFLLELEEESKLFTENFLISEQEKEILAVEDKYSILKNKAEQFNKDTTQIVANEEKAKADIRKKFADQELNNRRDLAQQQLSIASDALGAINDLVQAFAKEDEESARKAFNVNKAIGIAQAIVSTAQGIIAQLAVPQDALTGANFVKAGIVAATGAAQIATISKTQFQGSQSAPPPRPNLGAGAGTGASTQPPAFNVVGQSGFNQIATALGQGQPPIQAFVVSQDVTTAQQLDNAIIQTATF